MKFEKIKTALLSAAFLSGMVYAAEGEREKEPIFVKLDETVISDTGFENSLRDTAKVVQIIGAEEIADRNFKNITEALNSSPLVNIREDEMGVIVDMRGSGFNAKATVKILVDGMELNPVDINHNSIPLNIVSISDVEKIEIVPGGNSVLFGDGATGGVINIITKTGRGERAAFTAGGRIGSFSSKQWELGSFTPIGEKFALRVDYSGSDNKTHRNDESYRRESISLASEYKFSSKERLTLKYTHGEEKLKSADMLTENQISKDPFQSGVDYGGQFSQIEGNGDILDKSRVKRDEISGTYRREIGDKLEFNLFASYQKSINDSSKRDLNMKNISQNGIDYRWYYADMVGTFTDEKLKVAPSIKYVYGDGSYLVAGYDFKNQRSQRDFDNFSDMYKLYKLDIEKESHGGYLFNRTTVGEFEFTQGYRREWTGFDFHKKTHYYHRVLPGMVNNGYLDLGLERFQYSKKMKNDAFELAVNRFYSETGNLYLRFERSFRTPAPTEFQDKTSEGYEVNNLDSEINYSIELGGHDYILGSYIGADLYYTRTSEEIYYNEVAHSKEWYYLNLGKTVRIGVDLRAEQYLDNLTLSQGFSYIHSEINESNENKGNEGNQIPYAPKLNFNLSAKYEFNEKLNGITTLNYKGKYYLDRENLYEKKAGITLDLVINYQLRENLKIFAGINNVLDRKNHDSAGIRNGVALYDPAPPRNYYGGFIYSY